MITSRPRWRTELGEEPFLPRHPPVPVPGGVVARAGAHLFGVAGDDGSVQWSSRLGDRTGDGSWLHVVAGVVVTDSREIDGREKAGTTDIVGHSLTGELLWRQSLPMIPESAMASPDDGRLLVVGLLPEGDTVLSSIDVATGDLSPPRVFPWPVHGIRRTPSRIIAWRRFVDPGESALVVVDPGSLEPGSLPQTAIVPPGHGCWCLVSAGDVVAIVDQPPTGGREIRVLDEATLVERSTVASDRDNVATDGERVYGITGGQLRAWSVIDGATAWEVPAEGALTVAAAGPAVILVGLGSTVLLRAADGVVVGRRRSSTSAASAEPRSVYLLQSTGLELVDL
jgi:hypothetical protein